MTKSTPLPWRASLAFLYGTPIGLLGGLIGLGGAEFRLPVLAGPLGYPVRQAVPLNLVISLVTLTVAFVTRVNVLSLQPIVPLLPAVGGLIGGAVLTAFIGATFASRLSEEQFTRIILILLVAIGLTLMVEGVLPQDVPGFLPSTVGWHIGAGAGFGLAIGLVSSLLGVAGGELIIPTLVFAFGANIKTSGTASLLVSIPTVVVGVARYASRGAFAERRALIETAVPMGLGSVVGAVAGGMLVGLMPAGVLKVMLGVILNVSALQIFRHTSSACVRKIKPEKVLPSTPLSIRQEIILATTASAQDSGLLDMLVPVFEQQSGYLVKVAAVGTGQALAMAARGESDVVLAHAPATEKRYLADGLLVHRRLVMYNCFLLVGPASDPAHVKGTPRAIDALRKIAEAKAPFVSRGDDSGTHKREQKLWEQTGIKPAGEWYLTSGQGMGKTLILADEKQAYVMSDRATYLAFQKATGLIVLIEGDPDFLNFYHVLEVDPGELPRVNVEGGKTFADFLLSPQVQDMLKTFGVNEFGEVLFHPHANKTEETFLQ